MMRLLHPELLWLLLPLAGLLIYLLFKARREQNQLVRFGDTHLVRQLMPDLSLRRRLTKDIALLLSIGLMILALARPQMGSKTETVKRQGIEMIIALDLSNSMLSEDVKPSRLQRAKQITSQMMDQMENNKIGLVFFAGNAFVQVPITADLVSAKMFLSNANPDLISTQGTALADAISLATRSFSGNEEVQKAIVIITDAESHEGDVQGALKQARDKGIIVDIIGVGTPEGAPIPLADGGYLLDDTGEMVITKLNEQLAKEVVAASRGVYIRANDVSQTVRLIRKSLEELEQSELEMTIYSAYNEYYHIPLILALLLLVFDFIYLNRKNRYLRRMRLFDERMREKKEV